MAALISLSLWWIWLPVLILRSAASKDQKTITAESGQDVTLTCRAPNNNNIIVVEWSRADLGEQYVFMYRGGHFVPDEQHPSFKNRVDLQDRQMKDGDVSLILKNVTTSDNGTYECRVNMKTNRRKKANLDTNPISSIDLRVVDPPGQTGGHTEDGGKEDGGKEDEGENNVPVGLIIGLLVSAVTVAAAVVVVVWIYRNHKQRSQDSRCPPAETMIEMIEMSESFLNSESPADEHRGRNDPEANSCHQHMTRIPDVTLRLENELLHPRPQETAGPLPESDMRVQ